MDVAVNTPSVSPPNAANAPATDDTFAPVDLDNPSPAPAQPDPPARAAAAPVSDSDPGDTAGDEDPAGDPPSIIEAPRSWSKEDKEAFAALPRPTQERLAERERGREADFLRRQNEAADKLKGLTAKEQAVETERQRYAEALPHVVKSLLDQQVGEFKDLIDEKAGKWDQAKLDELARNDWPRYIAFQRSQEKLKEAAIELQRTQTEQHQKRFKEFTDFVSKEDEAFKAKVPDMADPEKADALQADALEMLKEYGYDEEKELVPAWNGEKWLRDHRLQLVLRDAVLWRRAQAKAKAAVPAGTPPPKSAGQGAKATGVSDLRSIADAGDMSAYIRARNKEESR